MQMPWLTRPPTAEEVIAHAKAYPTSVSDIGLWLCVGDLSLPRIQPLRIEYGRVYMADRGFPLGTENHGIRWLPCTAEGTPVCLAPSTVPDSGDPEAKAMQLFAVAQSALVDFLRGRGVTGNLDALALEMLTACAVDAPSRPEGSEAG